VRAPCREKQPVSRAELDVRPVDHELRPALEEDDPLVVILEERDRLREPTAQDLLDRQRRQLGEDGEPLAFGGAAEESSSLPRRKQVLMARRYSIRSRINRR